MTSFGMHALAEAARIETARVYGNTCPEHRQAEALEPAEAAAITGRPLESFFGPAPAEKIRDFVEALSPVRIVRLLTPSQEQAIEQGIARGWADDKIAGASRVDVDLVRGVRVSLDELSA